MRSHRARIAIFGSIVGMTLAASMQSAQAIHFYRGTGSGCSVADGALTDDPSGTTPNVTTFVSVGHNTFGSGVSGFDVTPTETRVKAGESITWTWNSSHCHSVSGAPLADGTKTFDSGFHYPQTPPESPPGVPGFFDYPILDDTPTLSFTHTFTTPGTFAYSCVHHSSIGMNGVVIVEA